MHHDLIPSDRDHEGKMARADLFKLAQYSFKLFKMLDDHQQLDGWVQAKITKSADYIASVYHYLEYEMKFSEYGQRLENSDIYVEEIKNIYSNKLTEAKKKMDKLRAAMSKKDRVEEGFADLEKYMKDKEKSKGTGKFDKKKISTGTVYTKKAEKDVEDNDDDVKQKKVKEGWDDMMKAVKDRAGPQPSGGSGIKKGSRYGGSKQVDAPEKDDEDEKPKKNKKVKEAAKPDYLDFDKDGNKKEPMKKALKDKKVKEDTRVAMRRGPGADMVRYEKDSPAPGAKKHRDDTAKAVKDLRASGQKLKKDDEKKVGDKTVDRYSRDDVQMKEGTGKCNESAKGKMCPTHGLKECPMKEAVKKGLYYNVNKRKKAGTSRDKDHPKAPSAQDWKNAAKTAKK